MTDVDEHQQQMMDENEMGQEMDQQQMDGQD